MNVRKLAYFLLCSTLLCFVIGCARGPRASMESLVAPLSWNQKAESVENPDSSSAMVLANVAQPTQTAPETDLADTLEPGTSQLPWIPDADESYSGPVGGEREHSSVAMVSADLPESDQRIRDLKAALSADAERNASERERNISLHPVRVRAESMVARAKDLLSLGQLSEAHRAAQQAVELTKAVELSFLPTEDRPQDVLQQVESAINRREEAPRSVEDLSTRTFVHEQSATVPVELTLPTPSSAGIVMPREVELAVAGQPTTVRGEIPVRVAANRPVFRSTIREGLQDNSSSNESVVELLPTVGSEFHVPELGVPTGAPRSEIPPFRGTADSWPSTDADLSLSQPNSVPAPPDVEELAPLPSVRSIEKVSLPAVVASSPTRPLFSVDAVVWALTTIGVICCVVGCGLTIRRLLEQR